MFGFQSAALSLLLVLGVTNALVVPQPERVAAEAKRWAGAAALATTVAVTPLVSQASVETVSPTAVSANVDVKSVLDSVQNHRSDLQTALATYKASVDALNRELGDVLPADAVSIQTPTDLKAAARDALSGKAQVVVNGEPVGIQIESEKGALTVKLASDILPKLPFLPPVPGTTVGEPETTATITATTATATETGLLDKTFEIGGNDLTLGQIAQGGLLAVGGAYGTSYAYYLSQNQPKPKKKAKKAAPKKKKAAINEEVLTTAAAIVPEVEKMDIEAKKAEPVQETVTETTNGESEDGRRLKRWFGLKREEVLS